jgi:hypothetical protein
MFPPPSPITSRKRQRRNKPNHTTPSIFQPHDRRWQNVGPVPRWHRVRRAVADASGSLGIWQNELGSGNVIGPIDRTRDPTMSRKRQRRNKPNDTTPSSFQSHDRRWQNVGPVPRWHRVRRAVADASGSLVFFAMITSGLGVSTAFVHVCKTMNTGMITPWKRSPWSATNGLPTSMHCAKASQGSLELAAWGCGTVT